MQIILAGAKLMNRSSTLPAGMSMTEPRFAAEAEAIAADMCAYSPAETSAILHCSPAIAARAAADYRALASRTATLMPAMGAYNGQAYKHLKASTLGADAWRQAARRLWILTFMYGMLRPLDAIAPYRIEADLRLAVADGRPLYEFWRGRLTDRLIDSVKADDGVLLHLATDEFQLLFDWGRVVSEVRVVRPRFMQYGRDGLPRTVTVHAKTCRGAMTRHVLAEGIDSPGQIQGFSYEGYSYNARLSQPDMPMFTR